MTTRIVQFFIPRMYQRIKEFFQDEQKHWVARLACGHTQHTRHNPPMMRRPWVLAAEGRASRIGEELDCVVCDEERRAR